VAANWFSLLPGIGTIWVPREAFHDGHLQTIAAPLFRPATADINMTLALSLTAFCVIHVSGIVQHGPIGHLKELSRIPFLAPVFIVIELFVVVSLAFRLFGNLFAGEVLLNAPVLFGFALGHIPLIGAIFLVLEMLFGLIQAVIFFMLSMVFTGLSVAEEPAHAEH
jgi:F-type H+-transporting ATPase subunit a